MADKHLTRVLVTNDDGINAPGLAVLERIAHVLAAEVWTVAPEVNHSGAGHSLTIKRPLRISELGDRRYMVDGTPTDCVLLALQTIIKEGGVDLVLSGVNRGGNLAEDITYSGTVAAAMEATLLGVPAIALSQCFKNGVSVDWTPAERAAEGAIRRLLDVGWARGTLMNVNFPIQLAPGEPILEVCRQGLSKVGDQIIERVDPRGEAYVWIGGARPDDTSLEGTDRGAIRAGRIAVTPVHLDMTNHDELSRLENDLA